MYILKPTPTPFYRYSSDIDASKCKLETGTLV